MTRETQVDRNLKALVEAAPRGVEFSQGEIARMVGCSRQRITTIEKQAVGKFKELVDEIWNEWRNGNGLRDNHENESARGLASFANVARHGERTPI
jgi:DNA-binding XRE family transcriptional regulator